jgi:hypothetical protein
MIHRLLCLTLLVLTVSCRTAPVPDATAVLWTRTAAEYAACGYQTYMESARQRFRERPDPEQEKKLEQEFKRLKEELSV